MQLRLDRDDTLLTGTPEELTAQFNDHWRGILNAAAGGDYADMTRPEMDLAAASGQDKPTEVTVESDNSGGLLTGLFLSAMPGEQEFRAMIDMTTSNIERCVGFRQSLSLQDLLAEGEAMPPKNRQQLYVMLRSPRAMEYHFQETLIEIAVKCRLLISSVLKDADGAYERIRSFSIMAESGEESLCLQYAKGARQISLWPHAAQPRNGTMLVFAQSRK